MSRRARRRRAAERRFRLLALLAVVASVAIVAVLLGALVVRGASGFVATRIAVPLARSAPLSAETLAAAMDRTYAAEGGAALLADDALAVARMQRRSSDRAVLQLPANSAIDVAYKRRGTPTAEQAVTSLAARGALSSTLNLHLFRGVDATDAASAGLWGALKGSLLVIAVTLAVALPLGVAAAVWLAEFAPRARVTDAIEVSIANLAAVPSIIFGLLGLALFLGTLRLPRSSPLVAGLTLALMTLPMIVIAARAAIQAVSPSIRDAARALGASPIQTVLHHVLPLAAPGIMTGTILATARALGETAPLLLIGMRAFVAAPPRGIGDPATVLPMQVFLWSDEVSGGFVEKTSAAILVLLAVLLTLNAVAIAVRNRFEARR